ncbi:hypothetical protein Tco_1022905 [Tanacetum coccineum]
MKQTLPLVFVPKVYSTSQSDTVDIFIKDRECEVFIGKIPFVNSPKTFKLTFYGPDWWSMMDELAIRPGEYFALTLVRSVQTTRICFSGYLASGVSSGFGFILARTQVWRMESYALKFADDVLLGIFMNVPAAWGRPVWTGVDDILLLAPVLKHLVPSLLA